MSSRKRQSETSIVTSTDRDALDAKPAASKSRLKIRVKRFHGVARWTWNAGSDDEVCGICQSAFEGVAPGIKYPGDECPVVFGKCGHAFHLQCVATWLNSSRQTCPICRYVSIRILEGASKFQLCSFSTDDVLYLCILLSREWEYGQSSDQQRGRSAESS